MKWRGLRVQERKEKKERKALVEPNAVNSEPIRAYI